MQRFSQFLILEKRILRNAVVEVQMISDHLYGIEIHAALQECLVIVGQLFVKMRQRGGNRLFSSKYVENKLLVCKYWGVILQI